jgi:cation:H+ antiporter
MMYLMVGVGLTLLLIGGDVLVRGAVSLAEILKIPPLVIGLTVVAFGTSAPELVVSLNAVLGGVPELAIGNVVGSNIANVLLVLGLPALIFPIACEAEGVRRDTMVMIGVSVAFILLCWTGEIALWQGVVMVTMLVGYLYWSYRDARKAGKNGDDTAIDDLDERPQDWRLAAVYIIGGFAGLIAGSELLVTGAISIARGYGISDAVIGLTLVALGTSLPELATATIAAMRRHGDVAIGNVVGSNLFNILAIMGITATVKPVPVPAQFLHLDLWIMLGAAVAIAPFAMRKRPITRLAGLVFVFAYLAYMLSLFNGHGGMAEHLKIAF